jgi:hypothetical protein
MSVLGGNAAAVTFASDCVINLSAFAEVVFCGTSSTKAESI